MSAKIQFALLLGMILGYPQLATALVVQGEDSTTVYNRFISGYPSNPVENGSFFAGADNFHGVGWNAANGDQSFALITPRHIIGANHYTPGVGSTIDFLSSSGSLISRSVSGIATVQNGGNNTDVFVAQLNSDIASIDVEHFLFPSDTVIASLIGREITTYGFTAQAGQNTISSRDAIAAVAALGNSTELANTPTFEFIYDSNTATDGQARAEVGDSGSPTFVNENGQLVIVGTHSALAQAGTTYTTGDADLTRLIPEINDAIGSLGSTGYTVEQIPEPSVMMLFGLGSIGLLARRRRIS